MDKTNPDSWFEHEFGPYSAVADYANEPPRGMTNPPMNLALREVLCKDLVEYGLQLQVPEWGGGFGRSSSSSPATPSRSQPRRLARLGKAQTMLMNSYTDKLRTGQTLKSGSIFSRSAPAFATSSSSLSRDDSPAAHPDWHQYHPFPNTLRPIDKKGRAAGTEKEKRSVRFAEDAQKSLNDHIEYKGSPIHTEFIKTPSHHAATKLGMRMTLDSSGKRQEAPGPAKKGKESGKDSHKDEDAKQKHGDDSPRGERIDNKDLDNRMRSLRGMSQLHRAAVADRFRFGASASAGEPMVLKAASLNQANPGIWSSDASFLNKFHNSSVRILAPSGLEMLTEESTSRRKQKKKKKEDEEELKMSDSGLFVARYPIDANLIALRRIRKKAFPEEVDRRPKGPTQEEIKAEAAAKLKTDLGGALLARIRDSEQDVSEQNAAVAAAGYDIDYGV